MQYFDLSIYHTREALKERYYDLAKEHHPDFGGDVETMQIINAQYSEALSELTRSYVPIHIPKPVKSRKSFHKEACQTKKNASPKKKKSPKKHSEPTQHSRTRINPLLDFLIDVSELGFSHLKKNLRK